jgi:hypothetical protein
VPQNFIPCLVSMGVVDALEMVDIQQSAQRFGC